MHIDPNPSGKFQADIESRLRGDAPKFGERTRVSNDSRLTKILAWIASVCASFIVAFAIWAAATLVNVDKRVSILLDRPQPVSKEQYDSDRKEMGEAVKVLQRDVSEIKLKQAEARYGR